MALDAQRNWDLSMADNLSSVKSRAVRHDAPTEIIKAQANRMSWITSTEPRREIPLPVEIIIQIMDYIYHSPLSTPSSKQRDLHACSLVSLEWNAASTAQLYASPFLQGPNYDLFTRTICPSINISVRKSPLATLVKDLDLTLLVHQGSKSVTARLLGRTKHSLEHFAAPQASFSLNCFPALGKCSRLLSLDLSLVSEASPLRTLFDTVAGLSRLRELHLPRSSGFGAAIDPASIRWPAGLRILGLSGGLDESFWTGKFSFPEMLEEVRITHCPRLNEVNLTQFLISLAACPGLRSMTFSNLPVLQAGALNSCLAYLPRLRRLSISADYVTPEVLNPMGVAWHQLPPTQELPYEDTGGAAMAWPLPVLALEELELTTSGRSAASEEERVLPLDVLMMASDYRTLPVLRLVVVDRALGWYAGDQEEDRGELDEYLQETAGQRGQETRQAGVRMLGPRRRR